METISRRKFIMRGVTTCWEMSVSRSMTDTPVAGTGKDFDAAGADAASAAEAKRKTSAATTPMVCNRCKENWTTRPAWSGLCRTRKAAGATAALK